MPVLPAQFSTRTLSHHPQGTLVQEILASAIYAVEPGNAVRKFVRREGDVLTVDDRRLDLSDYEHVYLIAIGKASQAMSEALAAVLGDRLTAAWVVPKQDFPAPDARFEVLAGGHPVPTQDSVKAGEMLLAACRNFGARDLVFCLISGGGSALVTLPEPGVHLQDMQALTGQLLACGVRIDEINTLRRHLDRIKGGGLAEMASPARMLNLILSDVVNSPLEAIASGPTAPDPSTLQDALNVLEKYHLTEQVPQAILRCLRDGKETLKLGDPIFERVRNVLIADNYLAARAAGDRAEKAGMDVVYLGNDWQGEARDVAGRLTAILSADPRRNTCWIAGGETTVTLRGKGKGGRNQELALAAVEALSGQVDILLLTLATDGEDGPTDAAGAVVSGETQRAAQEMGLDAQIFLQKNDAYRYFETLGDLLLPGPSGTNVNDLAFLFRF